MSNVLARKRKLSELEFWKNGTEIRSEFVRYLMNEKKVPKRWRVVITFPGVALAMKLMEEVTAANSIYPTSDTELAQRRHHQNEAIIACEQIIQHIQFMVEILDGVRLSDFETLGTKVIKEVALLKSWRKANKVLTPKRE